MRDEFADHDLAVVTVSVGASPEGIAEALNEAGVLLPTLVDERAEVMEAYRVSGTPTTYLIGEDGTVLMSDVGYSSDKEDELRGEIRQLLEE
jgi:peroxiredoxin